MHLFASAAAIRASHLFPTHSLRRIVLHHRDACIATGLDAGSLAGEDDRAVVRWLDERAGLLPGALVHDLERIDELTDDRGASMLMGIGTDAGIDFRSVGRDPFQVAAAAFLDHRVLFERAHGRRAVATLRGCTEFVGRRAGAHAPFDVSALHALEIRLGQQFDARARSAHCRVAMGCDGDRLIFNVAHGSLIRCDESLDDRMCVRERPSPVYLPETRVQYRPHRRDVVVYDAATGCLRVRSGDAATVQAYRCSFGGLLFGDPDWFGTGPVVSLQPLVIDGNAVERPTAGIRDVRVVGLIVRHDADSTGTMAFDSEELWSYLRDRLNGSLAEGVLVEAIFRVWTAKNPCGAPVKVRTPNHVAYGRVSELVFRPYLEARGFLATSTTRGAA